MGKGSNAIQNNKLTPTADMREWTKIYARLLIAELPVEVTDLGNGYYRLCFYNSADKVCASFILGPRE